MFKTGIQYFYPYRYRLELCEKEGLYKKYSVLHISDSIKMTVVHIWLSVLLNDRVWSELNQVGLLYPIFE